MNLPNEIPTRTSDAEPAASTPREDTPELAETPPGDRPNQRTFKLTIAYEGTSYFGWQLQPNRPTVQGAVEQALERILRAPTRVTGSSRTDSGVHALGQVVSFTAATPMPAASLGRALQHHLPEDIAVRELVEAPAGFHAIRDAVRKRYRYVFFDGRSRELFRRRYCWQYWEPLDADAMHAAGQGLIGTHDFRSFESQWPTRDHSIRTILDLTVRREPAVFPQEPTEWLRTGRDIEAATLSAGGKSRGAATGQGDFVHLEVEANGFLYNMVRTIAGTLLEVGRGKKPIAWPREVVDAQTRHAAGRTAPPEGLFLLWIEFRPWV